MRCLGGSRMRGLGDVCRSPSFHLDARDAVMAASEEGEEEKLLGGGNNDVDRQTSCGASRYCSRILWHAARRLSRRPTAADSPADHFAGPQSAPRGKRRRTRLQQGGQRILSGAGAEGKRSHAGRPRVAGEREGQGAGDPRQYTYDKAWIMANAVHKFL